MQSTSCSPDILTWLAERPRLTIIELPDPVIEAAGETERLDLVRRAEQARELKVKLEAAVHLGPSLGGSAAERHLARRTAERQLMEADRAGRPRAPDPAGRAAASSYVDDLRRVARPDVTPEIVGPDEPSLF